MDGWQLAILVGAALVAMRSLLVMTLDHRARYRRRRERERLVEQARANADATASDVAAAGKPARR